MIDDSSVAAASDCCGASSSSSSLAISGVSCRLPGSSNIDEFAANLHASIDMTMRRENCTNHAAASSLYLQREISDVFCQKFNFRFNIFCNLIWKLIFLRF
ncbi:MAG: hypothetical protein MHMPM18_002631 [Marteilia pararefringens]